VTTLLRATTTPTSPETLSKSVPWGGFLCRRQSSSPGFSPPGSLGCASQEAQQPNKHIKTTRTRLLNSQRQRSGVHLCVGFIRGARKRASSPPGFRLQDATTNLQLLSGSPSLCVLLRAVSRPQNSKRCDPVGFVCAWVSVGVKLVRGLRTIQARL